MTTQPLPSQNVAVRSGLHLGCVCVRRLLASRQTMVSAFLLGFSVLVVVAWSLRRERTALEFVDDILLPLYVAFLLPMLCLCYGTASVSVDRDERTLVYLLLTPLPRPVIHLAKYASAMFVSLLWTLGGMLLLCRVAGDAGWEAFRLFWLAVLCSTLAYVGLFHLLGVVFRRATIIALAYAVFLETFVGNTPGIAKRVAITFYTRCLIFDAGSEIGLGPAGGQPADLFLPVSGQAAAIVLCTLAAVFLLAGTWFFTRKEYV